MSRRFGSRNYGRDYAGFQPYVPQAERRRQAAELARTSAKKGRRFEPVVPQGRDLATSFWGAAWCKHVEAYALDPARLQRGRTYLRNGSVIHLEITRGQAEALVSGSSVYRVRVEIDAVARPRWEELVERCAGSVSSLVELLSGRLSRSVMQELIDPAHGLFPMSRDIRFRCSCPDWASLCKHIAAVLYGIGTRLDDAPELLFVLRGADAVDLVSTAAEASVATLGDSAASVGALGDADLGALFDIDLEPAPKPGVPGPAIRRPSSLPPSPRQAAKEQASALPTRDQGAVPAQGVSHSTEAPASGRGRRRRQSGGAILEPEERRRLQCRVDAERFGPGQRVRAADFLAIGIPRSTYGNWVTTGVLVRTRDRGVYRTTAVTEDRVFAALERLRS